MNGLSNTEKDMTSLLFKCRSVMFFFVLWGFQIPKWGGGEKMCKSLYYHGYKAISIAQNAWQISSLEVILRCTCYLPSYVFFLGWNGCCNGAPLTKRMVSISYITISNPSQASGVMTICNRGWSHTSANIVRKAHGEVWECHGLDWGLVGGTLSCKHSPWTNPPSLPG